MKTRLVATVALVAGVALAHTPAFAGTPKGFEKSFSFTDSTPDPSGNANSSEADHCDGVLPKEKPIEVKLPGPGYVNVALTATGDWSMQILDAKGEVLTGDDVNPPDGEALYYRAKKAQTIKVFPCNMTGAPSAKVRVTYTFKR